MEKIIIQFEPTLNDYHHVIRSFLTRKRSYWVSLGILIVFALIVFVFLLVNVLNGDFRSGLYFIPILLLFVLIASIPLLSGWLTTKNASKKENLTLPAKYELDDEKVIVVNQIAEVKYDWSMFSKAFDDGQYYFITYSTNQNMFQFIPKRACTSNAQEDLMRALIIHHMGDIENTQQGLTGWKLTVLTAVLFAVLIACVVLITLVFLWF